MWVTDSEFLFFKQKTAYEMRISDWSSDVCSSDLRCRSSIAWKCSSSNSRQPPKVSRKRARHASSRSASSGKLGPKRSRSEEHTSELQSLMRISYAVFCLKIQNTVTAYLTNLNHHSKLKSQRPYYQHICHT